MDIKVYAEDMRSFWFGLTSAFAFFALVGCVQTDEQRLEDVRPGCVNEKVKESGYTEDFALLMCEGEALVFGSDVKPDYRSEIDEAENRISRSLEAFKAFAKCLERWDFSPPVGECAG